MAAASSGVVESGRDYTHDYDYKYYYYYNQLIIRSVPWYYWAGRFVRNARAAASWIRGVQWWRASEARTQGVVGRLRSFRCAPLEQAMPPFCVLTRCAHF